MQNLKTARTITKDHPALAGHFPGNPVVPGVLILDCVLQALHDWQPDIQATRVQDAKFTSPLLPDEPMQIRIELRNERRASFECRVAERVIAQGRLTIQRNAA